MTTTEPVEAEQEPINVNPQYVINVLNQQLDVERRNNIMLNALVNQQRDEIAEIRRALEALVAENQRDQDKPEHNGRVTKPKKVKGGASAKANGSKGQ